MERPTQRPQNQKSGYRSTLVVWLTLGLSVFWHNHAQAQSGEKTHRIVFHLATADTLAHKALVKQISNVLDYWKTAVIEVVVHNNGIGFMKQGETRLANEIAVLKAQNVIFAVCENTLKQRKIDKSQILPTATFVPVGIAEIVLRQEEGWAYIKAGF